MHLHFSHSFSSFLETFAAQSVNSTYLWVIARAVAPCASSLELCNLESEREVGVGTAPRARVTPLYHRGVDSSNFHLIRFHYSWRKQNIRVKSKQGRRDKERHKTGSFHQRFLTYFWQVKVFGVRLHQKVLARHVHSDVDLLVLLGVGTVLLVQAGNPVVVHRTAEVTVTWGARPELATGIHGALSVIVVGNTVERKREKRFQNSSCTSFPCTNM